jgi:hypothetical protein
MEESFFPWVGALDVEAEERYQEMYDLAESLASEFGSIPNLPIENITFDLDENQYDIVLSVDFKNIPHSIARYTMSYLTGVFSSAGKVLIECESKEPGIESYIVAPIKP